MSYHDVNEFVAVKQVAILDIKTRMAHNLGKISSLSKLFVSSEDTCKVALRRGHPERCSTASRAYQPTFEEKENEPGKSVEDVPNSDVLFKHGEV